VVSHDRYFMDKIVDHLFILEVMEWSKIFQYSDFRAYEDSTEVTKEENKAEKKDWKQNNRLEFDFQRAKEYQKIEKKSRI
jgi:ATP-binding cassette subfamily F protein uup